jgi:hypothetical protein
MKKLLFAALLVAGTTLGFAKDNVIESKNKSESKTEEKKKEDGKKPFKICTTIWTWQTTTYGLNPNGGGYYQVTTTHTAQTSSWCGANDSSTTFTNGNPNP